MFYEEKLINGRLWCRGTPTGEWQLVTIEALTRRVLAAEADLERAMENHADDLSAAPEARTIPEVLFDGPAVYDALLDAERYRTSPQNVSAVLDAVVRIMRGTMNRERS